jgi:ADP-ribosylglycohydrolase
MKKIDRAQGCLIGLACGDALGDLGRSDVYRRKYGIVTNFYDDARSTDDTEFAVLSARILLDCGGQLTTEAILAGWHKYIIDQGGMFARGGTPLYGAVENLRRGLLPPESGRFNVNNNDDGAAMRAAPFGIFAAGDPDRAARLAGLDAEVSHYADGVWAAQAVAAAVSLAMAGAPVEAIWREAIHRIPEDSWLGHTMKLSMQICEQAGSIEAAWEQLHTALWTPTHAMAAEALPQIFGIFRLTGGDFQKGMFWACNFGRDADTIGAVTGALCGALHGIQAIPAHWISSVQKPSGVCLKFSEQEDMLALAEELCALPA